MSDYPILDTLTPEKLKTLDSAEIKDLCSEIRSFLIENVAKTGGHLASNLGVVELSVALALEFDTSRDRIIYDVGHQCYVHKLLTGRREGFASLRQFDGMSGFPKPSESVHDAFIAGHASSSISVAAGMARARTVMGDDYNVVAVIGDGALTGGMAYEALDDSGRSNEPLIVILNDNNMSISPSVGALAQHLSKIRLKKSYSNTKRSVTKFLNSVPGGKRVYGFLHRLKQKLRIMLLPGAFFESMGYLYIGPGDGHDVDEIRELIKYGRDQKKPVVIHLKTQKGNGYRFSQEKPTEFHGISKFNASTGKTFGAYSLSFSSVFGSEMCSMAANDPRIVAVTAAMTSGTGLDEFASRFSKRFIDVGIAEEHAVTMAAGMAKQGLIPVCAIYSTFLQRAYDQLIHDVGILGLHVVFAVDRAGITGEDGETHQGLFDPSFLAAIPGFTILCPANESELRSALRRAVFDETGPVVVRYPRGHAGAFLEDASKPGKEIIKKDENPSITLLTYGILSNNVLAAAEKLNATGYGCEVIKLFSVKPINMELIRDSLSRTGRLLSVEDCVCEGSVGQRIAAALVNDGVKVSQLNAGDSFLRQGSVSQLQKLLGLDCDSIVEKALELIGAEHQE